MMMNSLVHFQYLVQGIRSLVSSWAYCPPTVSHATWSAR
uniref:Uncharacterized protein n=1 Tax=Anopheles albimanus TaxID=7167 RepID=A0A182FXD2_ANOAL